VPLEQGVRARVADAPWGPWSDPTVIFSPDDVSGDHGTCRFMHRGVGDGPACTDDVGCDNEDNNRQDAWGPLRAVPAAAALASFNAPEGPSAHQLDLVFLGHDGMIHTSRCFGFGRTGATSCTRGNWSTYATPTTNACLGPPGGYVAMTARGTRNPRCVLGAQPPSGRSNRLWPPWARTQGSSPWSGLRSTVDKPTPARVDATTVVRRRSIATIARFVALVDFRVEVAKS
jgi:hypothetical protein